MRSLFHLEISGTMVALYGAVLATITAIVQVVNFLNDRANVRLQVRPNMRAMGLGQLYHDMTLVILTAVNAGKRPVTISGMAAALLYQKDGDTDWWLNDVRPQLPHEITEGKEASAYLNQEKLDFQRIAYWYVWDSLGRQYRLNVAPWYKRLSSHYRRKFA